MDILWLNVFNTGEIEWKLTTGKKSLIKQLLYSYEKKVQSFYYLSRDFFCIFCTFPGVTGYGFNWQPCKWQLELRLLPLNMPWHCHGSTIIFCITRCLTLIETICWVKPLPTPDSCLSPKKPLSTKLSNVWWKIFFCRKKRKINK